MPLEMTDEQRQAVIDAMATAVGRLSVWAKSHYSPESVAASLPILLEIAWPLIRDMVLEEAQGALDALETENEVAFMGHQVVRVCDVHKAMEAIGAMKGQP